MSSPDSPRPRGPWWSALAGLALALSFPHADLWGLGFVALIPFLMMLERSDSVGALRHGYVCGVVFFSTLLYWVAGVMVRYGGLAWPVAILALTLLVLYLSTYLAIFALVIAASWRRYGPLALLAAPVVWVGCELVRARALTGFPWGLLGYSQTANLPLLQSSTLGGIYAVSFLVMAANSGIALLWIQARRRREAEASPRGALTAGCVLVMAVLAAHVGGSLALRARPQRDEAGGVRVAAVQANVTQESKWDAMQEERILSDLERLTRQAARSGARIIVWPESSSPFSIHLPSPATAGTPPGIHENRAYTDRLSSLASELKVSLIVGGVDYRVEAGRLEALNCAFGVAPDGSLGPSYCKNHLVPFGEYVPLGRLLFFVDRLVGGAIAGFARGARLDPLPTPAGAAATFICYEAIFPELVRRIAAAESAFLVNITNDAWFGRTAAPLQHLAMAAVRAVENRRHLVRAANTGISALVDPYGRIVSRTRLGESAVLAGTVEARSGTTPYARAGDLFAWGCAILTLLHVAALPATGARPDVPATRTTEPQPPWRKTST
jgi:apolipoprotein N-acyltransferase